MKQDNEKSICVLVKNENNAFPIAQDAKRVGLMGVHSYRTICSAPTKADGTPRLSLSDVFKAEGFRLNGRAVETYEAYAEKPKNQLKAPKKCFFSRCKRMQAYKEFPLFSEDSVHNVVDLSDAIIVTFGRELAEGEQYRQEKGSYFLTDVEKELLANTRLRCTVRDKQFIVLLNVAHPVEIDSWKEIPDAILYIGIPGPEGAKDVVDVLRGRVKPSDKLPEEWTQK